jgi:hypothetical protein
MELEPALEQEHEHNQEGKLTLPHDRSLRIMEESLPLESEPKHEHRPEHQHSHEHNLKKEYNNIHDPELDPEIPWTDLLSFGTEQILKGTDTGTLVAFATLAFNGMREKLEPHHGLGCSFLLFSLLMCALVHFAIGSDSIGRAKKLLSRKNEEQRNRERRRRRWIHRAWFGVAWMSAIAQLICLAVGLGLVLQEKPPVMVLKYLGPLLQKP